MTAAEVEFFGNVRAMIFHGVKTDAEAFADFFARKVFSNQL